MRRGEGYWTGLIFLFVFDPNPIEARCLGLRTVVVLCGLAWRNFPIALRVAIILPSWLPSLALWGKLISGCYVDCVCVCEFNERQYWIWSVCWVMVRVVLSGWYIIVCVSRLRPVLVPVSSSYAFVKHNLKSVLGTGWKSSYSYEETREIYSFFN